MRKIVTLLAICILLSTCSACQTSSKEKTNTKKQIILAMIYDDEEDTDGSGSISDYINKFNDTHENYEIIVKNYYRSDNMYDDAINLIQREIVSGEGPDIIDYRFGYSLSDVIAEYTEDMNSYISNDRELQEDIFTNIVESFQVNGKLLAIPTSYSINTYVGRKTDLGSIDRWDISSMIDVLDKSGKKYPIGYNPKSSIFASLTYANLDEFVDWENGNTLFDSNSFRKALEYANRFDYEYDQNMTSYSYDDSVASEMIVGSVYDTAIAENKLGTNDVVYPGYPCSSGYGKIAMPWGHTFAISMASNYKDQSWEFIRQFFSIEYQETESNAMILSLRKSVIDRQLEYAKKNDGREKASFQTEYSGERYPIYSITEKQADDFLNILYQVDKSSTVDEKIYTIVCEETDAYFAGEKSMDEVIDNIEKRTWIYVSEKG